MIERKIGDKLLTLSTGDITEMDVDAFVFDITEDVKLGSGYGGAIQQRGGIIIQKELDAVGSCPTGQAVVTQAGELKASCIIHTNGPKFREENEEWKLRLATLSALEKAEESGVKRLAFPPIGTGLYQVPLDLCSRVMVDTIKEYLANGSSLDEVRIVAVDGRELTPFAERLKEA